MLTGELVTSSSCIRSHLQNYCKPGSCFSLHMLTLSESRQLIDNYIKFICWELCSPTQLPSCQAAAKAEPPPQGRQARHKGDPTAGGSMVMLQVHSWEGRAKGKPGKWSANWALDQGASWPGTVLSELQTSTSPAWLRQGPKPQVWSWIELLDPCVQLETPNEADQGH